MKSELENDEGAGLGREGKRSSFSLLLTLFRICFHPFPILHHCLLRFEQASSYQARNFFPFSMQVIYRRLFRSIDILKAHTHPATIPALACVKRHLFFYFPFCCRGKFLAICFWWWCFIVDRNELKYFLKRSLQSTLIVIHRNVNV